MKDKAKEKEKEKKTQEKKKKVTDLARAGQKSGAAAYANNKVVTEAITDSHVLSDFQKNIVIPYSSQIRQKCVCSVAEDL